MRCFTLTLTRALSAAVLLLAAASAQAAVRVHDAWIRWLPAGLPAGAYLTLHNDGDRPVQLVGASSPDYGMVMLHRSQMQNGTMVMRHVDGIAVPAHGDQALAPGGYHIMLMQAKHDIQPGQRLPLTLRFDDGEQLTVEFEVRRSDGQAAPMQGMDMNSMHGMGGK